jgi:aldehyde:ferredoxin oxidoreductase
MRAGWTPATDTLPTRVLEGALSPEKLRAMISTYYRARGWTEDGFVPAPLAQCLGLQ